MKQDGTSQIHIFIHVKHSMTSNSSTFEGYFARRRLKRLLISILVSFIFFGIIYYRENTVFLRIRSNQWNIPKLVSSKTTLSSLDIIPVLKVQLPLSSPVQPAFTDVGSSIEFLNSPYLDLEFQSINILPIIVLSKAANVEVRDAIRRTWGLDQLYRNNTIQIKAFFLVGTDDYTIKRLRAEQMIFGDVIHVSIPDTDSFSAYKELSAMIWIRSYLPNVPFYIKTDDDVILNMPVVIDKLFPIIESVKNEYLIIGWFGIEHTVQRGTYQKFVDAVLPPLHVDLSYAMSLLYIVTSKASDRMLDAVSHVDFIEQPGDPFVTGTLRDAAHVQIKNLAAFIGDYQYDLSNGTCSEKFQNNSKLLLCTASLRIGLRPSVPEYFKAWNILLSQN